MPDLLTHIGKVGGVQILFFEVCGCFWVEAVSTGDTSSLNDVYKHPVVLNDIIIRVVSRYQLQVLETTVLEEYRVVARISGLPRMTQADGEGVTQ